MPLTAAPLFHQRGHLRARSRFPGRDLSLCLRDPGHGLRVRQQFESRLDRLQILGRLSEQAHRSAAVLGGRRADVHPDPRTPQNTLNIA